MNILEKLQQIQLELKVQKGQKNKFGGYNYRSAEDILEAIKPLANKHKVMFRITEELLDVGGSIAVKSSAVIYDLEEQEVSSISSDAYAIIDFDAKGMQNPQRTGSASSYAKKYALGNLLLIDDTADSDATNTHSKQQTKPALVLGSQNHKNAIKAIESGKYSIEDIKKKYSLTEKVEEGLKSIKVK